MTQRARGTFDVKMIPQPPDETTVGRMTLDKQFHGDLEGSSKGQMLAAGTPVKGSAAYVALETVTGSLQGRSGTFVLHHTGLMTRGNPNLMIAVVADSGTGELTGLAGTLAIEIIDGKHTYSFDYDLPETK